MPGADFAAALALVMMHEGGYQNDPRDRGNWTGGAVGAGVLKGTKYGISAASFPTLDIANLTPQQAGALYEAEFWRRFHIDELPAPASAKVMDMAVNCGGTPAVTALQRALAACGMPVAVDALIGPVTVAAARACDPQTLYRALCDQMAAHYRAVVERHPEEAEYLGAWLRRAAA
ncbi:MAG TPA: glycosyl hydrolase 108 family protein [Aliidongia sp.]|nr:glycosyl hydrolase 108 family protein [Aliidongia sp.]